MKKILSILLLLVILSGTLNITASASRYDDLPPVMMKSFSAPTDQINHFM